MAPSNAIAIKPGLLVALRTSVNGGVSYARVDLEAPTQDATGTAVAARWETTRVIVDPDEFQRATKTRSAAVSLIRGVCVPTSFGLLCPQDREAMLDDALARASKLQDEHNATAKCTRIELHLLKGRIAATDEQAVRTINAELSGLVASLSDGVQKLDPTAIRAAADRARELAAMLSPDRAAIVSDAVAAARAAAREIVKRVEKKGESAAIVLRDLRTGAIEAARIAFLDMGDDAPAPDPQLALPAVVLQRFEGLVSEDADHSPAVLS